MPVQKLLEILHLQRLLQGLLLEILKVGSFLKQPTLEGSFAAVDALVSDGLLKSRFALQDVKGLFVVVHQKLAC